MGWLIFYILVLLVSLGIGYLIASKMLGQKAATRNLKYVLPWLLAGFVGAFLLAILDREYRNVVFPVLYVAGIGIWVISWPSRKQKTGHLIFRAGKTAQTKLMLWVGILEGVLALCLTWDATIQLSRFPERWASIISMPVIFWTIAVFFIALGLDRLEIREKGLCFMYTSVSWERMTSYEWEVSKPDTLTIRYNPVIPVMPKFMSIKVAEADRAEVDSTLSSYIENPTRNQP